MYSYAGKGNGDYKKIELSNAPEIRLIEVSKPLKALHE